MGNTDNAQSNDIDIGYILRRIMARKLTILVVMALFGGLTYAALSLMKPVYSSEARILIKNGENSFTRSSFNQSVGSEARIDNSAVGNHTQILKSNDLAQKVISALDLKTIYQNNSQKSLSDDEVLQLFLKNVSVAQVPNSHVIGIKASSHSPELSARLANRLSDEFIAWQQKQNLSQTTGATSWLQEQIVLLRSKVAKSEAALQKHRAKYGILTGENNITLDSQQLTAVNRELLSAKTRSAAAKSRVDAMAQIMRSNGNVNSTTDILRSGFIQRLLERRISIEGRMSELSSSLMPSHPRMIRLSSELKNLQSQIALEMKKVIASLKNEAKIALTAEASLEKRLRVLKQRGGRNSAMQAKLKEMQRDLDANRTTLVGYMNRYQDVSGRKDNRALPTQATIISKAHKSLKPSFPKSIMAFAIMAAFSGGLLSLLYFGTQAIMSVSTYAAHSAAQTAGKYGYEAEQGQGVRSAAPSPSVGKPFGKVSERFAPTSAPRH